MRNGIIEPIVTFGTSFFVLKTVHPRDTRLRSNDLVGSGRWFIPSYPHPGLFVFPRKTIGEVNS